MLFLLSLALIFLAVAMTRPGPNRLFRGRYRRHQATHKRHAEIVDPTIGLRDPARPL